jgi:hypothetical protein
MLDWHGREKKAVWWEYFRFRDLSPQDLLRERAGLADITFLQLAGGTAKAPVHRYRFALQDTDIRAEDDLRSIGGEKFGRVAGDCEGGQLNAIVVQGLREALEASSVSERTHIFRLACSSTNVWGSRNQRSMVRL